MLFSVTGYHRQEKPAVDAPYKSLKNGKTNPSNTIKRQPMIVVTIAIGLNPTPQKSIKTDVYSELTGPGLLNSGILSGYCAKGPLLRSDFGSVEMSVTGCALIGLNNLKWLPIEAFGQQRPFWV